MKFVEVERYSMDLAEEVMRAVAAGLKGLGVAQESDSDALHSSSLPVLSHCDVLEVPASSISKKVEGMSSVSIISREKRWR